AFLCPVGVVQLPAREANAFGVNLEPPDELHRQSESCNADHSIEHVSGRSENAPIARLLLGPLPDANQLSDHGIRVELGLSRDSKRFQSVCEIEVDFQP